MPCPHTNKKSLAYNPVDETTTETVWLCFDCVSLVKTEGTPQNPEKSKDQV